MAPNPIDLLWAERSAVLTRLEQCEDEPTIDALADELAAIEDRIDLLPCADRDTVLRRLELAAHHAQEGQRYAAARTVAETLAEVIAWLKAA